MGKKSLYYYNSILHIFEVGKKTVYYFGHEVQGCVFLEEHVFKIVCKNADNYFNISVQLYIKFQESCQSNYWISFLKEKNATFLEDFAKMCWLHRPTLKPFLHILLDFGYKNWLWKTQESSRNVENSSKIRPK